MILLTFWKISYVIGTCEFRIGCDFDSNMYYWCVNIFVSIVEVNLETGIEIKCCRKAKVLMVKFYNLVNDKKHDAFF